MHSLRLEFDITVIVWSSSSPRFSKDPLPMSRSACHLHPPCQSIWLTCARGCLSSCTVDLASIHKHLTHSWWFFALWDFAFSAWLLDTDLPWFSRFVCLLVIISAICPWARFKPPVSWFLFTCFWMNPWLCCSCYLLLVRLSACAVVSLVPNPCFPLLSRLQLWFVCLPELEYCVSVPSLLLWLGSCTTRYNNSEVSPQSKRHLL